jgi:hypothetical protein
MMMISLSAFIPLGASHASKFTSKRLPLALLHGVAKNRGLAEFRLDF